MSEVVGMGPLVYLILEWLGISESHLGPGGLLE
jgi:hypothetical protein